MKFVKDNFQKLLKNQLVAGSLVLFVGTAVSNFGNYLYHLLMGRMLGPIDYGILASLISLTYLFNIPMGTLNLVVVKYVSALRGKKELGAIAYFHSWLNKKVTIFALAGFFLLTIASPLFASFLHLESTLPILLVIAYSLVGVYLTINTAALQGFLRFGLISVLGVIQVSLKLIIAVLLVYLVQKVLGAISAILISTIFAYLLTAFFVKRLFKKERGKGKEVDGRRLFGYSIPVFFSTLAFTSLYTTDIVLARHFLPAQEAGFYAALATLGKIIFFATGPIIMVMFPMVSEKHANGKKYLNLLNLSLGLVFLICLGISGVYFLFPKLMVNILYGSQYLLASSNLWFFAVFLSFYSLSYLLMNFYLSVKKVKVVSLAVIAALLQVIFIFFFHQDLKQIAVVSIAVTALLFFSLLLYYVKNERAQKLSSFGCYSRL